MCQINTPDDWWKLVDQHWINLLQCFQLVGMPLSLDEKGYWWALGTDKQATRHDKSLVVTIEELKKNRDPKLVQFFHHCWWAAPDSRKIHGWPSWHVLCDLCSEEWVFEK